MPGVLRRGSALCVDLFVAVGVGVWITLAPGVFVPLDRMGGWQAVLGLPVCLAIFGYLFLGPAILANTYGRYLLGVRVVDDATGARPRPGQAFTRALTVGLWPIEALLIAVSRSGRRLGDRWANTRVFRYTPSEPLRKRLLPDAVAVLVVLSMVPVTSLIARRMDVSATAREYARRELAGSVAATGFARVMNDSGWVSLRMDDGRSARVHLVRDGGQWRPVSAAPIRRDEVGRGFFVQRGGVAASSH